MKRINTIFIIILLITAGCGGHKQSTDDFVSVDVMASYSKKELILQDFMEVEYIPLETTDEFLCQGIVLAIGKEIILVRNQINDGNIFVFDKNGKGLRKINRKGGSGEEYSNISVVILDEDNGEMFINDVSAKRILVYDLYGKFKRSIRHKEDFQYDNIYNFGRENLICDNASKSPFIVISKQDGSIVNDIQIPYEQAKLPRIMKQVQVNGISMSGGTSYRYFPIIPYQNSWILTEPSSDTIFIFSTDYNKTPFIVRTPSIQSMSLEIFLFPRIITDRYYFMEIVKKEDEFPKIDLIYDRQEDTKYEYTFYNDDYSNKRTVDRIQKNTNDGIVFWQKLEAHDLVESYEKGELKGKLKEIAANLGEEDNSVIMLVKYRE